jgi:hypothetical protein
MLHAAPTNVAPSVTNFDRIADRTICPRWTARTLARLGAGPLDRKLIAGADPAGSTLLAARACRLTSSAHRESLADSLDRLLQGATHPDHPAWRVMPSRTAVERQADELRSFASLLRSGSPLYAGGIAMLGRLLSDGTGPVYVGPSEMLARRLGEVRTALSGGHHRVSREPASSGR